MPARILRGFARIGAVLRSHLPRVCARAVLAAALFIGCKGATPAPSGGTTSTAEVRWRDAGPTELALGERVVLLPAEELAPDDPAWNIVIRSMAHALATITFVLSPRRIIVGGSVRKAGRLGEAEFFARLRRHHREVLNGYIASPALEVDAADPFIVPPSLGDDAGVCGAIALAVGAKSRACG